MAIMNSSSTRRTERPFGWAGDKIDLARDRQGDQHAQTGWVEVELGAAALGAGAVLDQVGAEAAAVWLLHRWPSLLAPVEEQLVLAVDGSALPPYVKAASSAGQRAVFQGVGGEFVQDHGDRRDPVLLDADGGTAGDLYPVAADRLDRGNH